MGKDDQLPESIWRLIRELHAAGEEEERARDEWLEHVNSAYSREVGREVGVLDSYRTAKRIIDAHEADRLDDAHPETLGLARAYVGAIRKRQDADALMMAEFAVSRPDLLDDLNRDVDPLEDLGPEP